MLNVILYRSFGKDINSTKRPDAASGAAGATYQCEVFEDCSLLSPVLKILRAGTDLQTNGFNYAFITTWNKYYWLTDMVFREGFWYIHLNIDVLATYKTGIGSSLQYVLRSSSNYDPAITDLKYPTLAETRTRYTTTTSPFEYRIANGTFIVGIANDSPNFGAIHYAALTMTQFQMLLTFLLSTGSYFGSGVLDDMSLDTAKVILNPMQYIVSCKWMPFSIRPAASGVMKIGWWTSNISDYPLPLTNGSYMVTRNCTFDSIPRHPQASETQTGHEKQYLNSSPYSHYQVWLPPVGFVDVPASMMAYADALDVLYQIDVVTGLSIIRINSYSSDYLKTGSMTLNAVQVGIDIPLAQITQDWRNNAMQAATNIASQDLGSALTNVAQAALGYFVLGTPPSSSTMGAPGYLSAYSWDPQILLTYTPIASTNRERFGQPLCANTIISTLSGFVQCMNAHVDIAGATRTETEQIESFMNEGFFYE